MSTPGPSLDGSVIQRTTGRLRERVANASVSWYALVAPEVALFLLVMIVPFFYAIWISLHQYHPIAPENPYIGLENYRQLLTDSVFRTAVVNTILYTVGVIAISIPLSLLVAVLLDEEVRGTKLYSTAIFVPVVTSWIVVSLIWGWLYQPQFGLLNAMFEMVGLPRLKWHRGSETALASLIVLGVWKSLGFNMVIFLAGIRSIPDYYYEAAELNGASVYQQFRYVTLPLLKPTTFFVTLLTLIGAFRVFTPVFAMTEGGPGYATQTIVYYFYVTAFVNFEMGYASAMAVVLLVVVFVFSIIQQRTWGQDVDYST